MQIIIAHAQLVAGSRVESANRATLTPPGSATLRGRAGGSATLPGRRGIRHVARPPAGDAMAWPFRAWQWVPDSPPNAHEVSLEPLDFGPFGEHLRDHLSSLGVIPNWELRHRSMGQWRSWLEEDEINRTQVQPHEQGDQRGESIVPPDTAILVIEFDSEDEPEIKEQEPSDKDDGDGDEEADQRAEDAERRANLDKQEHCDDREMPPGKKRRTNQYEMSLCGKVGDGSDGLGGDDEAHADPVIELADSVSDDVDDWLAALDL